jgi:hypothetical protein
VSNASDDLPEPETPVRTMRLCRGSRSVMFCRLCSRAPRTTMSESAASTVSGITESER